MKGGVKDVCSVTISDHSHYMIYWELNPDLKLRNPKTTVVNRMVLLEHGAESESLREILDRN